MEYAIAIGSNLADRMRFIRWAIMQIEQDLNSEVRISKVYTTRPLVQLGVQSFEHPNYVNAVVAIESSFSPEEVLFRLAFIEHRAGRSIARTGRIYNPRTVDLDIIAAEDTVLDTPNLTLPHPRAHERDFVLKPLLDVMPDWCHPRLKLTARELLWALETVQLDKCFVIGRAVESFGIIQWEESSGVREDLFGVDEYQS